MVRWHGAYSTSGSNLRMRRKAASSRCVLQPDAKLVKRIQLRYPDPTDLLKFEAVEFQVTKPSNLFPKPPSPLMVNTSRSVARVAAT